MKTILEKLNAAVGSYKGEGINHDNEKFVACFELQKLLNGKAYQIKFEAESLEKPGVIFHSEVSTIAPNISNGLSMFNLNTNTPFLAEHVFVETSWVNEFVFRFGDIVNQKSFREEVHIRLGENELRYEYHWGMPDGDFQYRSGASMRKAG